MTSIINYSLSARLSVASRTAGDPFKINPELETPPADFICKAANLIHKPAPNTITFTYYGELINGKPREDRLVFSTDMEAAHSCSYHQERVPGTIKGAFKPVTTIVGPIQWDYSYQFREDRPVEKHNHRTKLLYERLCPCAQVPQRASPEAAGLDLFTPHPFVIGAGDWGAIPTGIAMRPPQGTYIDIKPRSSLAISHNISVLAGVVDRDYNGEITVVLHNGHPTERFIGQAGDAIAQAVITPCRIVAPVETHPYRGLPATQRGPRKAFPHYGYYRNWDTAENWESDKEFEGEADQDKIFHRDSYEQGAVCRNKALGGGGEVKRRHDNDGETRDGETRDGETRDNVTRDYETCNNHETLVNHRSSVSTSNLSTDQSGARSERTKNDNSTI